MDIAALLNIPSVAPAVDTTTPNDSTQVGGQAFAGMLADAIGNGVASAVVLPGAVGIDGPPIDNYPISPGDPSGLTLPGAPPAHLEAQASIDSISGISKFASPIDVKETAAPQAVTETPLSIGPAMPSAVNLIPPADPKIIASSPAADPIIPETAAAFESISDATLPEAAPVETAPSGKKSVRGAKNPPAAQKVGSPPDPPPTKVALEKGAATQAPNAPVEKPDPNSKDQAVSERDIPIKLIDDRPLVASAINIPLPTVPSAPVLAPSSAAPAVAVSETSAPSAIVTPTTVVPMAVTPTAADAMALVAKAATPQISATKVVDKVAANGPPRFQTASGSTAPVSVKELDVDASLDEIAPAVSDDQPAVAGQPLVALSAITTITSGTDLPDVVSPPVLSGAPDLGIVPQVVQAVVPQAPLPAPVASAAVAQEVAVQAIPNAEVAKVAQPAPIKIADRPAAKIDETSSTPSSPSLVPAPGLSDSSGMSGNDDPSSGGEANPDSPEVFTPANVTAPAMRTAATEKPESGSDRPSLDRHLVVRQVADRIETLAASRPKDGVVIHLEPRDLGTITLVVKGLQSALDVQVMASDDRVRQSLDASRPELAQALAPRGIDLRELRISTASSNSSSSAATNSNSSGGNPNGGNPNPDGRSRPQNPSSFVKASRTESAAPRASRGRSNGRGVDLLA